MKTSSVPTLRKPQRNLATVIRVQFYPQERIQYPAQDCGLLRRTGKEREKHSYMQRPDLLTKFCLSKTPTKKAVPPRISAQYTYAYRALNDYERWCFNRLYNDFFYHRHNDSGMAKPWKLPPLIESTNMLCCAEDLGMTPGCVPAARNNRRFSRSRYSVCPKTRTEVWQHMENPNYSVCTTSTHDMGGIRQWWRPTANTHSALFQRGTPRNRHCAIMPSHGFATA